MWQFVMNFPAHEKGRADFAGEDGGVFLANRLPALACFMAVAALHIVFISVFDLFRKSEKPFTETRELFLTLEAADNSPEEAALIAAREAAPLPAVPLPEEEVPSFEAVPDEAVPKEIPLPPEESGITSPAEETAAASFPAPAEAAAVKAGNTGAPAGFAPQRPMTDAEYLALIMGRLEKNKIYPLSVRKRGIEGDITAAFTIRPDGTVSDLRLADPSGHRFLAQAAFETIRSAGPFPVREGREGDYTARVTIRYRLEDQTTHKK
ncbi:MAG: TonB family protein [Treponema sp.]|jgi:TonB family protein|nr:TonB family protein [Treponema sp.]